MVCVFAGVREWSVPPEHQNEALRAAEEKIGPALSKQPGYRGDLLLGDRHSGKMLTVTLWEDEQACTLPTRLHTGFGLTAPGRLVVGPRAQATTRSTVPRASGIQVVHE